MDTWFHLHSFRKYCTRVRRRVKQKMEKKKKKGKNISDFWTFYSKKTEGRRNPALTLLNFRHFLLYFPMKNGIMSAPFGKKTSLRAAASSEYTPIPFGSSPVPAMIHGTLSCVCVFSRHGVGWSGVTRIRYSPYFFTASKSGPTMCWSICSRE